jgi:uncharacterized protein (TIRG00374 family)
MLKHVLLFAAGIILTIIVVSFFGLAETVAVMLRANVFYLLFALILQLAVQGLVSLRFYMLARQKSYIKFSHAFSIQQTGNFVSVLTPIAKIGGEPLKIYMLRQFSGTSKASSVVAVDTFLEIISSIIVVFVTFLLFLPQLGPSLAWMFIAFLLVALMITGAVLKLLLTPSWMTKIVDWFVSRISRFQNVKKKDYTKLFYDAFVLTIKDRNLMITGFGLSFITKILEITRIYVVFLALGIAVPANIAVVAWSVILVMLMIPWLPGSLGLVEFGAASAFMYFGIASSVAASAIVLDRLISLWFVLFIGAVCIYFARKNGLIPDMEKKHDLSKLMEK